MRVAEVATHRRARPGHVACGHGAQHRAVLDDRLAPAARVLEVPAQLLEQGLLRSSKSSVTTRTSAALSLASASATWKSRSPRMGITPRAMSSSISFTAARMRFTVHGRFLARRHGRQFGLDQLPGAHDVEGPERAVDAAPLCAPAPGAVT